jgi:hypothetical protein
MTPEDTGRRQLLASGELRVARRPRAPYPQTCISLPDGVSRRLLEWVRGTR